MVNIKKKYRTIILTGIMFLLSSPLVVWGINTLLTGFKTTTVNQEINAHNTCRQVKHTGTQEYFVPTKTAAEWNAFLNNKPTNVSAEACHGNWYTTGTTASCNSFCAGIGLKSTTTTGTNSADGIRCSSNNYYRSGVYTYKNDFDSYGNCLTYNASGHGSGTKITECFCGTGDSSVGVQCGSHLAHGFSGCAGGGSSFQSCSNTHLRNHGYAVSCDPNPGGGSNR